MIDESDVDAGREQPPRHGAGTGQAVPSLGLVPRVGIVGPILAVPLFVVARDAIARLRAGGFFTHVADRAQPTVQRMLE